MNQFKIVNFSIGKNYELVTLELTQEYIYQAYNWILITQDLFEILTCFYQNFSNRGRFYSNTPKL